MIKALLGNWDKAFITDAESGVVYSYGDFFRKSFSYCKYFQSNGLCAGSKIFISLDNSIEPLAVYTACLISGHIAVPVDPLTGKKEYEAIKNSIGDHFTLTSLPGISEKEYDKAEISAAFGHIDYDLPFLITHTSGSTGLSKGVIHSFGNLAKSAAAFKSRFNFNESSVLYHNLPMSYMAGILNQFIMPMLSGSSIVIGDRFNIQNALNFWKYPVQYKCNVLWINPTIVSIITKLDRGQEGIDYLQNNNVIICVGTAPLYDSVRKAFEAKYNTALYESYGLSELLFITVNADINIQNSVGAPLDGVSINIAEDGEVMVQTPWSFLGYINMPPEEKDKYYPTGDLGCIKDGLLYIDGRKKDLIIKGGINLSIAAIESVLLDSGHFEELAVLGAKDEIMGEKIVCFYVSGKKLSISDINGGIVDKLGQNYKIDSFEPLDSIPKSLNNKVDRNKLRELL